MPGHLQKASGPLGAASDSSTATAGSVEDGSRSRLLVVLRVGRDHRTSGWAKIPQSGRDWDLLLSPFEDIQDLATFDPNYLIPAQGGKWDQIAKIFADNPQFLSRYTHFWFPDDDLECAPSIPDKLLAEACRFELALCQPALERDSYYSHFVTLAVPYTRLRYTNFVELMAPLMTRDFLESVYPLMTGLWAGKGLDFIWQNFVSGENDHQVAVLDTVLVGHYRQLGCCLASNMQRAGVEMRGENRKLLDDFPAARWFFPQTYRDDVGRGRIRVTIFSLRALFSSPSDWRGNVRNLPKILLFIFSQSVPPIVQKIIPARFNWNAMCRRLGTTTRPGIQQ